MKLIIDIPDKVYTYIQREWEDSEFDSIHDLVLNGIKHGTPLPKGHGRLGDLDAIWNELKELEEYYSAEFLKKSNVIHESAMNGRLYGFTNSKFIVQDAPTIIESDKAESEE